MTLRDDYLAAYDDQLRTDAETPSALRVERLGPLRLVTFPGGRGFVTYRDLAGADAGTLAGWVGQVLDHYRRDPAITRVEWKTRGHDHAPRLHESLIMRGFEPVETDVRAMSAMQDRAFGDEVSEEMVDALRRRLAPRRRDGALGGGGRRRGRRRRSSGTRRGHRLRRSPGRDRAPAVARSGDLPRAPRGAGAVGPRPGQDARPQRLDARVPHPHER